MKFISNPRYSNIFLYLCTFSIPTAFYEVSVNGANVYVIFSRLTPNTVIKAGDSVQEK